MFSLPNFDFWVNGVWVQNFQTGYQGDTIKTCYIKNLIHIPGIRKIVVKSKKYFFMHFDPAARVFVISIGAQDTPLWQFFFRSLYLFDYIFSGIVWTNKLHDFEKGICFLNNCSQGNRKRTFFQLSKQWLLRGKTCFLEDMNLIETN